MKITKKQLRRIIQEERARVLSEMRGNQEVKSPLIEFAHAFAGLGGAVSEQVITVVNGYIENNEEAVYDINPNALDMAMQRLRHPLQALGESNPEAESVMEVIDALEWALGIFEKNDAEVDSDARAAGDR